MPRILLIGDHPEFKRVMEVSSAVADCEIVTAVGNIDAMRMVRARAIDVVITDPATPVHDDIVLVEELRVSRPGLKAILLAPTAFPAEIVAALRSYVFACFVAPFNFGEIAEMVRHALEAVDWQDGILVESGLPNWISLKVTCALVSAERLTRFMAAYRRDLPDQDRDNLMMAFREMLLNAMEHGAGFDSEKVVHVTAARTERAIVYHFRDPGTGFNADQVARSGLSSTATDPIGHVERRANLGLRPGGFGILVAKQIVDEMFYNERGNEVLLIKRLPS